MPDQFATPQKLDYVSLRVTPNRQSAIHCELFGGAISAPVGRLDSFVCLNSTLKLMELAAQTTG